MTTLLPSDIGLRLDRWIKKHYATLPYPLVQKLFRKKAIKVNGKWAKPDYRMAEGDEVLLPQLENSVKGTTGKKTSRQIDLKPYVIYEDADIIALNKPQGMAVQGGSGQKEHIDGSLGQFQQEGGEMPVLVHRLDKDTTGLLVIAKTHAAAQHLGTHFKEKTIQKQYWAICVGLFPKKSGTIIAPLMKKGEGVEKVVVDFEDGKAAVTHYKVLAESKDYSLVELSPETGRTHQLRVHTTHLHCPILGDGKYGGHMAQPKIGPKRVDMHLHARTMNLTTIKGKKLTLMAPLPPAFVATLNQLGFKGDFHGKDK